jgi:hypothetical protein
MANPEILPHLMRLLDDDSDVVREAVSRELAAFGADLSPELDRLDPAPTPEDRALAAQLVAEVVRNDLRAAWGSWFYLDDDLDRLETALSLIADFQCGVPIDPLPLPRSGCPERPALTNLLDELAENFYDEKTPVDAGALAHYLFEKQGIQGASNDYYAPQNSNLVYVIQARRGIPISLVCIYMLVGRRLGMDIRGCNWPGHFLARAAIADEMHIVDCYHEGHVIDEESFLKMQGPSRDAAQVVLENEADAVTIISRVLNNLIRAYQEHDNADNAQLMSDLLKDLERRAAAGRHPW